MKEAGLKVVDQRKNKKAVLDLTDWENGPYEQYSRPKDK